MTQFSALSNNILDIDRQVRAEARTQGQIPRIHENESH